jgi:hypothetical protein
MPLFSTAMLVAPAVATGVKTLFTAFNKPKRPQKTEMMTELERQISNNQSDIVNKTLMNTLTKGAKSLGSRMYQQSERGLDVMRNKGELSEGQYAKGLLEASTGIQSAVGEQTENAMLGQQQNNLQMQDRINNARLQVAQMKDQARSQYSADKLQWTNEMVGGVLDTAMGAFSAVKDVKIAGKVNQFLNGRQLTDLSDTEMDGLMNMLIGLKSGVGW